MKNLIVYSTKIGNVKVTVTEFQPQKAWYGDHKEPEYRLTISVDGRKYIVKERETSGECYREALGWLAVLIKKGDLK